MYAVVNHLQLNKPVDTFKESVENKGMPVLSKHAGFTDFHFIKVDEYNAIVVIIWEDAGSARQEQNLLARPGLHLTSNHFSLVQETEAREKLLQVLSGNKNNQ